MILESFSVSAAEKTRLLNTERLKSAGAQSAVELSKMLDDSSWQVRRAVIEALASLGEAAVEPLCSVLLSQRDNEARIAAAVDALVALKAPVVDSIERLAKNTDPAIAADGIQILGRRRSESSVDLLVKLSRSDDDIISVSALEALGRIGGFAAVDALIETIGSGSFFKTFPAIDLLGRSGDRRVIEPLMKLLSNPNYLPEAARALGHSGEKAAAKPLLELLKATTDSVVRVAALSLWLLRERFTQRSGGLSDGIDEIIRAGLGVDAIRKISRIIPNLTTVENISVCNLLGVTQKTEATPILMAYLDSEPALAEAAANALKNIGRDSESDLILAIRNGDSARRKILLPVVTRSSAATDVVACLKDPDADVRALGCETLARLGNGQFVKEIFALLHDSNLRVVHAATAAIQSLGTREARDLARMSANDANPVLRRASLRILACFGDDASLEPMLKGLKDSDSRVREVAIQGLPYLEDPRALSALLESTKSEDSRTRSLAVRSLAQAPKADERIYSILLKSLGDLDPWVRYYACQSLGRMGFESAAVDISKLLNDEAGQVRVAAIEALSHLSSADAHNALTEAARSNESDIKRAALVGLGMMHCLEDLPVVLEAVVSDDLSTRLIALSSLMGFQSKSVVPALANAALDTDEQICTAAIGILATRAESEATISLIKLLGNLRTFERAKSALLIPTPGRIANILISLNTANEELAQVLVSILARIQKADAKKALIAAVKLDNVAARKAAIATIANQRDPERNSLLKDAAENDPDEGIRKICSILISE